MNGPSDRVDFKQPMGPPPRHGGGSFRPMGFGGFRPMGPNGRVGGQGTRSIVGAGVGRGGFRSSGPVKFPPSESPDGRRFIGKSMESDYSVRPTTPPVQQPLSGQKRGYPISEHGSFTGTDVSDRSSSVVKLFVGSVPRTAIEEEVRPYFELHGDVLEVALIKDKKTGHQQGCCFVKYATSKDADKAIRALHNQITLPGGTGPVQVRYADGEKERVGALEFKLFVGSLNKQATEKEVEEIFLQFGRVEDVYLMRDEYRQSRGCGFVKYLSKETAMAAIDGLNGIYTMRGCNQPLIVRFADPKRPKPGESRDMAPPVGLGSGPRFQASGPRPTSNLGDLSGDVSHTNPWHPPNSPKIVPRSNTGNRGIGSDFSPRPCQASLPSNQGGPLGDYGVPPLNPLPVSGVSSSATLQQQKRAAGQQISPLQKPLHGPHNLPLRPQTNFRGGQAPLQNPYGFSNQLPTSQLPPQKNVTRATAPQTPLNINLRPTALSTATAQFPPRSRQQPLQKMQNPPSELAQLLSQQTQSLQATFQSSQQAISQLQQQVQSMQQPNQNLPLSQSSQAGKHQWAGSAIPTVVSTTASTPISYVQTAVPAANQSVVSVKCNWTEHTSPDGYKYYYNGVTGESKWEKPEEMVVFEREQQEQQQHQPKPTIQQPQTQLQPMQQQPQQVHQQYQGQQQEQQQHQQKPTIQQAKTLLQPMQQQPQQVHQQYQGQQQEQQQHQQKPTIQQAKTLLQPMQQQPQQVHQQYQGQQQEQQQHQQKPTIQQAKTLLQPMQQQPQQVHQQYQGQQQEQQQHQQKPTIQQAKTLLQPMQQQPQQVHQQYQGQQLQQPFYSSLYPTPGVNHIAQYPSLPVGQNSQFPMSAIGQNTQEHGRTHIPMGAASVNDLSRTQQSRQSPQELIWKNKA
ncbi:PREDICTED: flowering time control protein FCA isoform X2 [Camelina sativa]|uniref:Flowering time control protein FCA isoform X2 n=1 Tax=Camelina sativa TaxID=90675 RepID=A0ABM0UEZ6_CAMSA|nr:PREDICTED: flowering time control protein FCA isoform X2 [Camelina sativa]